MTTPALPTTHRNYEVEITFADGSQKLAEFGRRESEEQAEAAAVEIYKAKSARVLRVTCEHAPDSTPIAELMDAWEGGRYVLTDSQGRVATSEHGGGHLERAMTFLCRSRTDAKWKTLILLRTLRQAFREDSVNGHDFEIQGLFRAGPSLSAVKSYLHGARCRDRAHHGSHTF